MFETVMPRLPIQQLSVLPFTFDDPLDPDLPEDVEVVTTRRAMCRVATVAAEAGARFQREATSVDPMGWMLSPRRMFEGVSAMEACLGRDNFVRAIILHGLSLGIDVEPSVLDRLTAGNEDEVPRLSRPKRGLGGKGKSTARPSLYCATIAFEGGGVMLQAFHASVARHPAEVVQRLRNRFGDDVLELVEVRSGFHPSAPLAIALVPTAVAELLREVERHSDSPRYATFSYDTEQRLEA
jgi:hypothetical protein